jgi:hypothetical protein
MSLAYRTYRVVPTLIAFAVFLLAGSLLVGLFQSKPVAMIPDDEVQAVYFAVHSASPTPAAVDVPALRRMLGQLDPALAAIADRITVLSYTRQQYGFDLQIQHLGRPGRTYLLDSHGIR